MKEVKRILPIVAIYDNLIGYKNINITQNKAVAVRGFSNSIKYMLERGEYDDGSPADISLYYVGDFDMDTGDIKAVPPEILVTGTAIITEWHNSKFDNSYNNEAKVGEVNDNI